MSISQGTVANNFGASLATLAVTNNTLKNYRLFGVKISSSAHSVSSLSGGGVTTWTNLLNFIDGTNGTYLYMGGGVITSTGAQTVTVTYDSSPGATCELWSIELTWSGGIAELWKVVDSDHLINSSSTTESWPGLNGSSKGADLAYWGFGRMGGVGSFSSGSTSGFAYTTNGNGNEAVFNGTLTAGVSVAPTCTYTSAGISTTLGMVIQAQNPMLFGREGMTQAVHRAANWCKRESGLYAPERGFIVPRMA